MVGVARNPERLRNYSKVNRKSQRYRTILISEEVLFLHSLQELELCYYLVLITTLCKSRQLNPLTKFKPWLHDGTFMPIAFQVFTGSGWKVNGVNCLSESRFKLGRIVETWISEDHVRCDVTRIYSAYIKYLVLSYEPLCPLQRSLPPTPMVAACKLATSRM